ncbi:MAG: cupin domain-containing protein [Verrucomicrobiota bacterium]
MKKVNTNEVEGYVWESPKGKYAMAGKNVSIELGRDEASTDIMKRHPFDVEICTIPAGKALCPYHSHSAQWEFYHVIAGSGKARHEEGETEIEVGDAFLFKPGEAHQIINDGEEDLTFYIVADNPIGESCHYPDSGKWLVKSPERRLIRSEDLDYFDGEE